ncbi:MAG TPA: AzlC family ABC transporter permease [Coriobacteriia bacterium]
MRGVRLGTPVFLGYVPIGAAFGIVATAAGFTVAQTAACSALVFAGAGQFIAVNLLSAGAGLFGVLFATAILNLRHVLFSATLAPYLRSTPRSMQFPLAITTTDETFGVNITDLRAGGADEWSMLGVGVISWSGWLLGSTLGSAATSLIGDPSKWGVQFAMPAMFTALLVAQVTGRRHLVAAIVAAVLALALAPLLPGAWPVILGAMGAATAATVMRK